MKRVYLCAMVMMLCLLALSGFTRAQGPNPQINGRVWLDLNKNGLQTGNEPGVAGVEVQLINVSTGLVIRTTTTIDGSPGQTGRYSFQNIPYPDTFIVKFIPPPELTFTEQNAGNGNNDSDPNPLDGETGYIIILGANASEEHVDAGLIPGEDGGNEENNGSIGDLVWCDENGNGIQDIFEKGLPWVTVRLYEYGNYHPIKETTTDRYGNYSFDNLYPGIYRVRFIAGGYGAFTQMDAGDDEALDSDADEFGWTDDFYLAPGENNMDIDAGLLCKALKACIGDFVWKDCNMNGQQDPGEPGMPCITVQLYQWGSTDVFRSTVTNSNGKYSFCGLEPGDYYVKFILPDCYRFTVKDKAGVNDTLDSDADPNTGKTDKITLTGTNNFSIDAGMYPTNLSKGIVRGPEIPAEFALQQNYPNPFNPTTTIEFAVPADGQYTLKVFNALGQEVATLLNEQIPVGYHMVVFDASRLPSGVYIYRLSGNNIVMVKKMLLAK
ncbi:MAG: SdrD B-like domain-containing protein [Bacillota bacterium]